MHATLAAEADFVGVARVPGLLYDFGWHPAGVEGDGAEEATIVGEVFRMRDPDALLARLDEYEGYAPDDPDPTFDRVRVRARLDDAGAIGRAGEPEPLVWIYWYRGPLEGRRRIASGDWLAR
jgi:gamma-glutamylcyclotransferase (GGCT)/AIG2-like uncharacterized protein YtfP